MQTVWINNNATQVDEREVAVLALLDFIQDLDDPMAYTKLQLLALAKSAEQGQKLGIVNLAGMIIHDNYGHTVWETVKNLIEQYNDKELSTCPPPEYVEKVVNGELPEPDEMTRVIMSEFSQTLDNLQL